MSLLCKRWKSTWKEPPKKRRIVSGKMRGAWLELFVSLLQPFFFYLFNSAVTFFCFMLEFEVVEGYTGGF